MADEPSLIQPALHRIAKLLARAGVASRRDVERMIEDGRVALDGSVIETPATLLATLAGVTVDGEPVAEAEPTRLFLFHKPAGYLTAARDPMGRPTIYDRLPPDLPRLVPVGRLDLNTEGLLLLTTDGAFKRQLELPSTGVERAYRARAYGDVTQAQLEELIDGVEIDGIRYGSIDANLERRTGANVWVEMILTEGKNREVRRVLEHLGLQVSRLIRTRYGPFVMGDLPVGGIGEVRGADLVAFRHSLKNNTRLLPEQAGTITAAALPRGNSVGATNAARPDRTVQSAEHRASRDEGYDPARARTPPDRDRRVPTRGAFGARAAPAQEPRGRGAGRFAPGSIGDRPTGRPAGRGGQDRAPASDDRRRARPSYGGNEPDGVRTRRPVTGSRLPATDTRPDQGNRSDRSTARTRSSAIDPTHEARPTRDRPVRDDRSSGSGERPRPEHRRSQQPARRAPDTRAGKAVSPRPTSRDEVADTPRPPRPERKPGWARPKPKPGTRPGKPRK